MTRNKKLVKMMALAVAASTVATSVPAYAAFDATYYAQQNPDVVAAIGTKPADLEMHYNVFGKKEGRAGSADEIGSSALRQLFDAEYYAKLNPDVVAVYGNDANALFSHFLQFGIKEGRKINPYFDVNAYKKAYPDLVAAFGDDIAAYYNHFATNGIKEHRTLGGFPAEKIVPGGVAVASSGGSSSSSSSSSSGGGGGSSKPTPKPADTTPAPDPTPTPTPEPEPEPTPAPEPTPQEQIAAKQAAIESATAELSAELAQYDDKNKPTADQKAELVKATKDVVDSSRELKDETAAVANAAGQELLAAKQELNTLKAKAAQVASPSQAAVAASNSAIATLIGTYATDGIAGGVAATEAAVLRAQYNVEKAQAAYDDAVNARKEAQAAYDSAMDVARDLLKDVFNVDPSTYESDFLTHQTQTAGADTPDVPGDDVFEADGVLDLLNSWYKKGSTNTKALGNKLNDAQVLDANGKVLTDGLEKAKKDYAAEVVSAAKLEVIKTLLTDIYDANVEPARKQAIFEELYKVTAETFNPDGSVATGGGLVVLDDNATTVTYKLSATFDTIDNANDAAQQFDGKITGKVSGVDEDALTANTVEQLETDIINYEKCIKAANSLDPSVAAGDNAAEVLAAAKNAEKDAQTYLNNRNADLNGGSKVKENADGTLDYNAALVATDGAIKAHDEAVKDYNTAVAVREATYTAEGVTGDALEALRAADAQAEVVADDIVAKEEADIAAEKAAAANTEAEANWTAAKALDVQQDAQN